VFGYSVCEVVGCSRPVRQRGGLCEGCRHRYERGVAAGRFDDLDTFKRSPRPGLRSREEELCLVCRTDRDYYRPALGRTGLCRQHEKRRSRLGVTVEEFVGRDDVRPHGTFGACRRRGCDRLARDGNRLCEQCAGVWYRRGRPDLEVFCVESPPLGGVVPAVSLHGLPERVRLELLYVAQSFVAINLASSRSYWNELVLAACVEGVEALEELRDPDRRGTRRAMKALGVLYADPEEEFAQVAWDLHKLGLAVQHVATLDFTVIHQRWLRDAAKTWAREKLSTVSAGTLRSFLVALGLLSEVLRARPDGGEAPSALARSDMRAFRERLGRLHAADRVANTYFYHGPTRVRQFLREGAVFGLFDRGGPLHGLSADFAVLPRDIAKRAKDEDGEVGRSLPQAVVDQLLSERYIARVAARFGEDMRALIQVLTDTGRRPDEACALRATCLEKSEFIDSETGELQAAWILVHDMQKVGITNYRLAIAQSTAQVIIAQRERAQARYPDTPLSELPLFPRELQNPYGTCPVKSRRLNQVVRGWADALPELIGPAGEQYPRERVTRPVSPQLRPAARRQRHPDRRARRHDGPPHDRYHPRLLQGQQGEDAQGGRDRVGDAAQPPRQREPGRAGGRRVRPLPGRPDRGRVRHLPRSRPT
jgi:integrase